MKQYFLVLCSLFLMIGCTTEKPDNLSDNVLTEEFYAVFEDADSRTYVDEQIRMRWTAKDKITMFRKSTYNREYMFTGKTGANAGGFRQTSVDDEFWCGEEVGANYAVYPHSVDTELDETDLFLTVEMPSEQTYVMNSFGLGANTMVAVSEGSQLMFKNVGSCLRIRLYGEDTSVSSITLTSKGDESISGTAKITPVLNGFLTCEMTGSGKSIRLTCPTAVAISTESDSPTDFWIVVPPVTLSNGFSVTVEDSEGATQVYDVNQSFTFKRNSYYDFKREVTINNSSMDEASIPNNQIWYTATAKVELNASADLGATLISNEWDSSTGKGVITCDGIITSIENVFCDNDDVTSITIPRCVIDILAYEFSGCQNLTSIYCSPTMPPRCSWQSFSQECVVYVPNTSIESYKVAAYYENLNIKGYDYGEISSQIPNNEIWYITSDGNCYNFFADRHFDVEIKSNTFENGKGIITFNGDVTTIKNSAINSYKILSITFPNSVTNFEKYAFNIYGLREINSKFATEDKRCLVVNGKLIAFAQNNIRVYTIPEGIEKIGEGAFPNHVDGPRLLTVTIPESVTHIEGGAFYTEHISTFYCKRATPPSIESTSFGVLRSDLKIYVPSTAVEVYKTADGWAYYADYIFADPTEN